jgi:hypothetical protein
MAGFEDPIPYRVKPKYIWGNNEREN